MRLPRSVKAFIEGRIAELESKLSNAQIIDPVLVEADGRCVFGATVELSEDAHNGEVVTHQIVGDDEADIKQGKISISSPIARVDRQVFGRRHRGKGAMACANTTDFGRRHLVGCRA